MPNQSEKEIFLDAIEFASRSEREAFIHKACLENATLLKSVEQLLQAHNDNLSSDSTSSGFQDPLHRHVQQAAAALGISTIDLATPDEKGYDRSGENIHHFRLMEKLGEGGFGQVYVAQQQAPVRRDVALKLLKPGMDTRDVLARFEAEQQALALMNHPNIAQVYEFGATDAGQPYIAMELIRGIPFTTFCRKKRLPLAKRLELFRDVCLAVHHAHQKGVIHRDLKPSNVLLAMHDTRPVVKVIDFGIAKAINNPLTDKTIYTRFAQLIGTPMYMSPEQAELNALDIDTRSDIYSLGVLLYELLTDTTPISQDRLQTASFDEMRRLIREEEPPRPSVRLTTSTSNDSTIANEIGVTRELANKLRGDLDWIVMKAIDKDRHRRYDSAADFARDINCFLDDQPVTARPPSQWYRLSKLAKRNKLPLIAASLILLTMVAGTAISTWQAVRATRAQAEAELAKKEAVEFAQSLRDANVLLVSARANADQDRLQQAYEEYTLATELSPDHFLTWAGRGSLLAKVGAWNAAADDFSKAIELGGTTNDPSWWGVPQLLFFADRKEAYQTICQSLLKDAELLEDEGQLLMMIRAVCLRPIDKQTSEKMLELVERLQTTEFSRPGFFGQGFPPHPGNRGLGFPGGPSRRMPKELVGYTLALAHYRNGDDEQAQKLLEPLRDGENHRLRGITKRLAVPVLAMVYHRLGKTKESEKLRQQAWESDRNWIQQIGQSDTRSPWFDGLESHILFREASFEMTGTLSNERDLEQIELTVMEQLNSE